MIHKAFLLDTEKFHTYMEPAMQESVRDIDVARRYICGHLDELY